MRVKRTYKSNLLSMQAEATRHAILVAADRVCRAGGWPAATIAAVAAEAGVSKETIYSVFGTKAALIGEMVKAQVAGTTQGQHFLDAERPRAIRAEPDPLRQVELWASYLAEILERVSPLMAVVRTGADAEPDMDELYRTLHKGRRANLKLIAESLVERNATGLSVEEVTSALWQLASPEMFGLLTRVDGYSTQRFASWLSAMIKNALRVAAAK
jgi:AcrR family transcriptional regulator